MEIVYCGHSAFFIKGSKKVFIDPFLSGNPSATISPQDIKECDVVIATHDHPDHLGDAFDICKNTDATFVSQHELAVQAQEMGLKAEGMNIGDVFSRPVTRGTFEDLMTDLGGAGLRFDFLDDIFVYPISVKLDVAGSRP